MLINIGNRAKTEKSCIRQALLKYGTHVSRLHRPLLVTMLCMGIIYFALYSSYSLSFKRRYTTTTINKSSVDASWREQSVKPLKTIHEAISVAFNHGDSDIDVKHLVGYVIEVIKQEIIKEKTPDASNRNSNDSNLDINQHLGSIGALSKDVHEMKATLQMLIASGKDNESIWNTMSDENIEELVTDRPTSLLTLFSTWTRNNDSIHHNTFQNWASLKPAVHPVLFTNDSVLAKEAEQFGWTVLDISKRAINQLPVLKYMYMDIVKLIDSKFYCYANSDLLFDGGLLKTLVNLMFSFNHDLSSIPMLITGIRWNVINVSEHEITPRRNINNLVKNRGNIFITSAEDYFITNVIYPWNDIPELVVGSVAYDNWLVMNARERKHLTIDASKTISAIHQSVDVHHHRSHVRDTAEYNGNLLRDTFKINIPYHKGFLNCIETFTDIVNDTFTVRKRMVDQYCN